MKETIEDGIKKHITSILIAIIIAGIIAGVGMVSNNNINNRVLEEQLKFMNINIASLQKDVEGMKMALNASASDRWTRSDHDRFYDELSRRFKEMDNRVLDLERKHNRKD